MIPGRIIKGSSRKIILPNINKTETFFERTSGLLGCRELIEGQGLLIMPCNSIHTFFMKISIDVIFLRSDNTIAFMKQNMKPFRFAFSPAAASVLELMVGQIKLLNLQDGDQLIWEAK